jgi:hypothetical protein
MNPSPSLLNLISGSYNDADLGRFGKIEKYSPELVKKFMNWNIASL